jgi:hypothetical protein
MLALSRHDDDAVSAIIWKMGTKDSKPLNDAGSQVTNPRRNYADMGTLPDRGPVFDVSMIIRSNRLTVDIERMSLALEIPKNGTEASVAELLGKDL